MAASALKQSTTDDDCASEDDWDVLETTGLDWCGRGDSHVDFKRSEPLPLSEEKFLGHGARGAVYSTRCKGGEVVAWKRVHCPRGITQKERKEIDVLKRLSHKHVIKLVGSYTQTPYLGLLLWPVAVIDLASFLEGVDGITTNWAKSSLSLEERAEIESHVRKLSSFQNSYPTSILTPAVLLRRSIGCLASAVAYLHKESVRHKDLKPANILLYPDRLRLTDFGTSTDFSDYSQSATEGGERGTPKYFSPETAALEPCGRASDIFSLGCIFLEMLAVANGHSFDNLKQNRPDGDHSFHANRVHVQTWILSAEFPEKDSILMSKITWMLSRDPKSRPTIEEIQHHLNLTDLLPYLQQIPMFHEKCCRPSFSSTVCEIKKQWALQLPMLKDPISDKDEVDLLSALQKTDGDLKSTIDRISKGECTNFGGSHTVADCEQRRFLSNSNIFFSETRQSKGYPVSKYSGLPEDHSDRFTLSTHIT
jgi:serine/threonine protein kinase